MIELLNAWHTTHDWCTGNRSLSPWSLVTRSKSFVPCTERCSVEYLDLCACNNLLIFRLDDDKIRSGINHITLLVHNYICMQLLTNIHPLSSRSKYLDSWWPLHYTVHLARSCCDQCRKLTNFEVLPSNPVVKAPSVLPLPMYQNCCLDRILMKHLKSALQKSAHPSCLFSSSLNLQQGLSLSIDPIPSSI